MFLKEKSWSKTNTRVRKIHVFAKFAQHVFPWGPLQMLRDWESPGSTRCFVQEVSPGAPWWFQDPGGPMVGIAGGIVANIPSLGHTKSPAECPSVARIFVQMMVRWDKQTLWVVPDNLLRLLQCWWWQFYGLPCRMKLQWSMREQIVADQGFCHHKI